VDSQSLFVDEEDYARFIELLYRQSNPLQGKGDDSSPGSIFFAYCLMSNHVHLLIKEASDNLSTAIRRICASYTMHYKKKYNFTGHLFYDRFKSEPVDDNTYFFILLRYIRQHPVTAGLSADMAGYRWGSWREYEGVTDGSPIICSTQTILSRMSLDNFRKFVKAPMPSSVMVIEYESRTGGRTDEEVLNFLADNYRLRKPTNLQNYQMKRRDKILRETKAFGASLRQLAQLTGLTFHIVRKA